MVSLNMQKKMGSKYWGCNVNQWAATAESFGAKEEFLSVEIWEKRSYLRDWIALTVSCRRDVWSWRCTWKRCTRRSAAGRRGHTWWPEPFLPPRAAWAGTARGRWKRTSSAPMARIGWRGVAPEDREPAERRGRSGHLLKAIELDALGFKSCLVGAFCLCILILSRISSYKLLLFYVQDAKHPPEPKEHLFKSNTLYRRATSSKCAMLLICSRFGFWKKKLNESHQKLTGFDRWKVQLSSTPERAINRQNICRESKLFRYICAQVFFKLHPMKITGFLSDRNRPSVNLFLWH